MKLTHLTDETLHKDLFALVQREREILVKILWHLKEVDRRKLYSDFRCGSLFEYAVKILKYSEGQASRRISAARLLNELPELTVPIENGTLNLTQLNQAKNFFNDENIRTPNEKKAVIEKITGKSTRESEKILWELKKEDGPRKITVQLNDSTLEALNKVQGIKAHKYKDLDALLVNMCAVVTEVWIPKAKRTSAGSNPQSRYIAIKTKENIWKRDQAKCTNCGSTFALQLDHITPWASGGTSVESNLRLLCRNCNQRKSWVYYKRRLSPPGSSGIHDVLTKKGR